MLVSESVVTMQEVAIIRLKERNSAIVAFYLDKEAGYGFWMHDNGVFQYINYDNNAQYWMQAVNTRERFVQEAFKDKAAIISWHYNYELRELTFIDAEQKVWKLTADQNLNFEEDRILKDILDLDQ